MPIALCDTQISTEKQFTYISENCLDEKLQLVESLERGCDCEGNCSIKKNCSCWRKTVEKMLGRAPTAVDLERTKNEGYRNMRLADMMTTCIIECGEYCICRADKCCNRVAQRGVQLKLQGNVK